MAVRADERSLPGVILVWLLQVIGAVTAIIFGTFGVLSWRVADEANRLAADANDKSDRANSMSDVANLVALVFGAMRPDQFGRRFFALGSLQCSPDRGRVDCICSCVVHVGDDLADADSDSDDGPGIEFFCHCDIDFFFHRNNGDRHLCSYCDVRSFVMGWCKCRQVESRR